VLDADTKQEWYDAALAVHEKKWLRPFLIGFQPDSATEYFGIINQERVT
jgi:hypothetical protein